MPKDASSAHVDAAAPTLPTSTCEMTAEGSAGRPCDAARRTKDSRACSTVLSEGGEVKSMDIKNKRESRSVPDRFFLEGKCI